MDWKALCIPDPGHLSKISECLVNNIFYSNKKNMVTILQICLFPTGLILNSSGNEQVPYLPWSEMSCSIY